MINHPLISVIIPTYKRSFNIHKTINSVLNQDYDNIEIIVVDDNGVDTSFQIETMNTLSCYIDKGKIKYITHPINKNGSAARNTGLKVCKGDYVIFLDDDDILSEDCIQIEISILNDCDSNVGAVYCNTLFRFIKQSTGRVSSEEWISSKSGAILEDYLLNRVRFNTSAIMFKKSAIEEIGLFDESYYRHQDIEYMTRFFAKYEIVSSVKKPLLICDITHDRMNVPNPERDYKIKEKYLLQFSSFLESKDIFKPVARHFWLVCARNCLVARDYHVFMNVLRRMKGEGLFKMCDIFVFTKTVIKQVLLNFMTIYRTTSRNQ